MIYKSITMQRQTDGRYEIQYDGNTMMAEDLEDAITKLEQLRGEDKNEGDA